MSDFPNFTNGDVLIRLCEGDDKYTYHLHSTVLTLHCSYFKASLSGLWTEGVANSGTSQRRNEPLMRERGKRLQYYEYELRFEPGASTGILHRLVNGQPKDPTASECWNTLSEPAGAGEGLGAIVKIEDGRRLLADAHDEFFRLLYHQGVPLRKKRDQLRDMLTLWQVADMYMSTIAEG